VDTNVLVYAYDGTEPDKQERAWQVLDELAPTGLGALSAQILAEFVVAVTRKIPAPLNRQEARERVENLRRAWTVFDITGLIVLEAVRGFGTYRFSYWDSQIWATARLNQAPFVLSEDFAAGSTLEGVTFINPFAPDFDLSRCL
jgi:predicted nucleic acid-binding protein